MFSSSGPGPKRSKCLIVIIKDQGTTLNPDKTPSFLDADMDKIFREIAWKAVVEHPPLRRHRQEEQKMTWELSGRERVPDLIVDEN